MPGKADSKLKTIVVNELALFLVIFLAGLVVLPLFIYVTGRSLFGDYAGSGFSDFYGMLHSQLRSGQPVVWFLVLSPYLAWQFLRLTIYGFRQFGRSQQ